MSSQSSHPTPIIDLHMHLSLTTTQSWPGDVEEIEQLLREGRLAAINVQNIVLWMTRNLPRNPISLLLKLQSPATMFSFGGPRYPMPDAPDKAFDYAGEVKRLWALGFDGIKLFGKPNIRNAFAQPLDSPVFHEMFAWLQAEGVPVLYHISDPPEFWDKSKMSPEAIARGWYFGDGEVTFEGLLAELLRLLERFPRLRVVFPHFLFLSQDLPRLAAILDQYPSVSIDITPGTELYRNLGANAGAARDFFIRYAGRILFGTDNTGTAYGEGPGEAAKKRAASIAKIASIRTFLEQEQGEVHGRRQPCLALPAEVLEKIYGGNFAAFAGPRPRPVNRAAAAAYTAEMLALARRRADCPDAEAILAATLDAIEGA